MKEIPLTQGQVALVDDDVYNYLMQWKWFAQKGGHTYYAERQQAIAKGKQRPVLMHREVIAFHEGDKPELDVDHRDRNGLNNTYANLRYATCRQNIGNNRKNTSGYPGVSFHKRERLYRAYTKIAGKHIHIGLFHTAQEAHEARTQFLQEKGLK